MAPNSENRLTSHLESVELNSRRLLWLFKLIFSVVGASHSRTDNMAPHLFFCSRLIHCFFVLKSGALLLPQLAEVTKCSGNFAPRSSRQHGLRLSSLLPGAPLRDLAPEGGAARRDALLRRQGAHGKEV